MLCSRAVRQSESITSRFQPEYGVRCKQLDWRNLELEYIIRSLTSIPHIEKQAIKIGPANVYRPHHNDRRTVASYLEIGSDGFVRVAKHGERNNWLI